MVLRRCMKNKESGFGRISKQADHVSDIKNVTAVASASFVIGECRMELFLGSSLMGLLDNVIYHDLMNHYHHSDFAHYTTYLSLTNDYSLDICDFGDFVPTA